VVFAFWVEERVGLYINSSLVRAKKNKAFLSLARIKSFGVVVVACVCEKCAV